MTTVILVTVILTPFGTRWKCGVDPSAVQGCIIGIVAKQHGEDQCAVMVISSAWKVGKFNSYRGHPFQLLNLTRCVPLALDEAVNYVVFYISGFVTIELIAYKTAVLRSIYRRETTLKKNTSGRCKSDVPAADGELFHEFMVYDAENPFGCGFTL